MVERPRYLTQAVQQDAHSVQLVMDESVDRDFAEAVVKCGFNHEPQFTTEARG